MNNFNERYKRLDWEYRMEYNSVSKQYLDKLNNIDNRFYMFQYFTFFILGVTCFFAWIASINNNITFTEGLVESVASATTNNVIGIIIIAFVILGGPISDAIRHFKINRKLRKLRHRFLLDNGV